MVLISPHPWAGQCEMPIGCPVGDVEPVWSSGRHWAEDSKVISVEMVVKVLTLRDGTKE